MKKRLKHIALFFLTIFLVTQIVHLNHSFQHSDHNNTEVSNLQAKKENGFANNYTFTKIEKANDHNHCFVCHHFTASYHFFNVVEIINIHQKSFWIDDISYPNFSQEFFASSTKFQVALRGPPSFCVSMI